MIIVDCEASGLHPESYPIQIAWLNVDTEECGSFYIRPHETWTYWDYNAEEVHNIPMQLLLDVGLDVYSAAQRFLDVLYEHGPVIISDAPEFELFWLERLLDTANVAHDIELDVNYVYDIARSRSHARRMGEIMRGQKRSHDALDDCRSILAAIRGARDEEE